MAREVAAGPGRSSAVVADDERTHRGGPDHRMPRADCLSRAPPRISGDARSRRQLDAPRHEDDQQDDEDEDDGADADIHAVLIPARDTSQPSRAIAPRLNATTTRAVVGSSYVQGCGAMIGRHHGDASW